jgi:antagonist of KipI
MAGDIPLPKISEMGEAALLLTWGNRVSSRITRRVHALDGWLRTSWLSGVRDLVPAYASLLVVYDGFQLTASEVGRWLQAGIAATDEQTDARQARGQHHTVPVEYGGEFGPDLEALAAQEKCHPRDIVTAHTRKPFQVAFIGFLPGFAYMARLPRRSPVPRLATPRARVLAGSVGLAGFQTGIYPFSSPGGWRIIGRTGIAIWDPASDPPARFAPGDTVQFVESRYEPAPGESAPPVTTLERPAFEVLQVGGISLIQDLGRTGYRHMGAGEGGAFDKYAAQRANVLVGNAPGAAVLEMAMGGPVLRVACNVTIALDGADFQCHADSTRVPPRLSWFARAGTVLRFATGRGMLDRGMRAYLAVGGGFDVPSVLGSRSTSLLAGFGGLGGRAVREGDVLGTGEAGGLPSMLAGRYWPGKARDISLKAIAVRFVPFSGVQAASREALCHFVEHSWLVTSQSDRMGLRLSSPEGLRLTATKRELASFGVVPGAIQLPPGGEPVVLGPDCQTTGGYPLLGVVIQADMGLLAQARPGTQIGFGAVTGEEARLQSRSAQADLDRGVVIIRR